MKRIYNKLVLVDIVNNSEQIYNNMGEISKKIGIDVIMCYHVRNKNRLLKKRYYIRDYIEE